MNLSVLVNHRFPGESSEQFRERRRHFNGMLKQYLRYGKPATHARDQVNRFGGVTRYKYVPGPHPTHKPRYVVTTIDVVPWTDAYGVVQDTREFKVLHPGTLIKIQVPA